MFLICNPPEPLYPMQEQKHGCKQSETPVENVCQTHVPRHKSVDNQLVCEDSSEPSPVEFVITLRHSSMSLS